MGGLPPPFVMKGAKGSRGQGPKGKRVQGEKRQMRIPVDNHLNPRILESWNPIC